MVSELWHPLNSAAADIDLFDIGVDLFPQLADIQWQIYPPLPSFALLPFRTGSVRPLKSS